MKTVRYWKVITMSSDHLRLRKTGPILVAMSFSTWLLGLVAPEIAWAIAATVLVAASLFIRAMGIRQFLAICCIAVAHFVTLAPVPYGRSELPFDFMLEMVITPFTLASCAIAVWYWGERER